MPREIIWFDSIDSTMHEAACRAAAGCPHGTAICAEEQTAGIGRLGRKWHSERGAGLYVSIVLRPRLPSDQSSIITLALGLAVAEAITALSGIACDLRWPNDVLIGGRKVAGILVQLFDAALIAGIGVNVNHASFPPDLAETATSLRLQGGKPFDRDRLLNKLLDSIDSHIALLESRGSAAILDMFTQASSYVMGRRVLIDDTIAGTTEGLTPDGFLRLRTLEGHQTVIMAGGVRPAPGDTHATRS